MKHTDLKTRLNVRLMLTLVGFGLVFSVSLNYYLRALMENNVTDKTRLIFSNLLAVQTYVRETLRPVMIDTLPKESFIIEAMSTSYVTRKVMSDLNMASDQFSYRRVALDPRNPQYAANEMEREFIDYFQRNPSESILSRFRMIGDEEYYVSARPVVFRQSCLVCHGDPKDAPVVMLSRYGSEKGFGRKEGEIGGLDMLVVPVQGEKVSIQRVTIYFVFAFACGTLFILGFNHFFFDRIMVQNIGRLNSVLRSRFPTEADGSLTEAPKEADEVEGMVADMERFADHLRDVKEQLSDYAANLEAKVEARTTELRLESEARLVDVELFLDVIESFSKGLDRSHLLDGILTSVARRFEADGAMFYCFITMDSRSWPQRDLPGILEPDRRDSLLDGHGLFTSNEVIVPVQAMDSVRGALALSWKKPKEIALHEREILRALGRQLGVALENLDAMENILKQKAILESVFEGIADPLFLLDASGGIVHSNESALRLLYEMEISHEDAPKALGFSDLSTKIETTKQAVQVEMLLKKTRSFIMRAYLLRGYGVPGRIIVYARDNTIEKTMLARLQQGEKSLAVGKLAAGLAHEINNPLGVILCYSRLLWDNGKSQHAEDLNIIIRHCLQAQKVLQDLMRFASPKPVSTGPVRLDEAVEFIARVFEVRAAKHNITIEYEIGSNLPMLIGNANALEQILANIVINSMDALEDSSSTVSGQIKIKGSWIPETSEVTLTIADNGPGIPRENLSRLFDPFFTTKAVGKGTGLGLAVVYGLMRDLGGRVEVESRNGAVFTLFFKSTEGSESGTSHQ